MIDHAGLFWVDSARRADSPIGLVVICFLMKDTVMLLALMSGQNIENLIGLVSLHGTWPCLLFLRVSPDRYRL